MCLDSTLTWGSDYCRPPAFQAENRPCLPSTCMFVCHGRQRSENQHLGRESSTIPYKSWNIKFHIHVLHSHAEIPKQDTFAFSSSSAHSGWAAMSKSVRLRRRSGTLGGGSGRSNYTRWAEADTVGEGKRGNVELGYERPRPE